MYASAQFFRTKFSIFELYSEQASTELNRVWRSLLKFRISDLSQPFQQGVQRMIQFINYPELFKAHPQRFKVELAYTPDLDEQSPITHVRGGDVRLRIELPPVFTHVVAVQLQVLLTSGFGECSIQHEKVQNSKHKICVGNCPSYIYYVNAEELQLIKYWCEQLKREFK